MIILRARMCPQIILQKTLDRILQYLLRLKVNRTRVRFGAVAACTSSVHFVHRYPAIFHILHRDLFPEWFGVSMVIQQVLPKAIEIT